MREARTRANIHDLSRNSCSVQRIFWDVWAVLPFSVGDHHIAYRRLILGFLLGAISLFIQAEVALAASSNTLTRKIQYSFTLQNGTNRPLSDAEFSTYAPVKQTATQCVTKIESSHPYELETDELGNQVLHFKIEKLPPHGNRIISVTAIISVSANPAEIPGSDLKCFLGPGTNIESHSQEIVALAGQLKKPQPLETAKSIFRLVRANIKYAGYAPEDRGALYALRTMRGDCSEFMYLFIALCRANGIPARAVGGYICSEDSIINPNNYHNWAEVFLDGKWHIADPQKNTFMKGDSANYIAFIIPGKKQGFQRAWSKGEGLRIRPNLLF